MAFQPNTNWEKNHLALYMEQGRRKRDQFFAETSKLPFPQRRIRLFKMRVHDKIQSWRFNHRLRVDPEFRRRVMLDLKLYAEIQKDTSADKQDIQK